MPVATRTKLDVSSATQHMIFIGIDPGQSGGIAFITSCGSVLAAFAMPKTEQDVYKRLGVGQPKHYRAVIEAVHAMPGNGVTGMFKFGVGYGGLRMALTAAGIPFETVQPRTWQAALGIPSRKTNGQRGKKRKFIESPTQFKNRLKAKAQQLFPQEDITLSTCDALLIALYCQRFYK